jgi:acyl-CoA hydrolase
MTPKTLVNAMTGRASELSDVEVIHIHTEGEAAYVKPEYSQSFNTNCCFVGGNVRKAVWEGEADYIPVFLSEIPNFFRRGILPLDVALIQVSPPDAHGYCSLGVSVDVACAAYQTAKLVIAQINLQVPRTFGDSVLHIDEIDYAVETDEPIHAVTPRAISESERKIGKYIADMIDNGATLQMGIGAVPDAVLAELKGHKELGIHTEMFSDGLIDLVESGAVTGEHKKVSPNKITACFAVGTKKLYDFVHDNPIVDMREAAFTNDTVLIRKNPKVTAINSAVEIDLTGQVCADTIGTRQYSGVGGQMDFIRGASLSPDGKPIIALTSMTGKGISKIVPTLKEGAGVTTTRAHVHWIVTEYGAVNLYGKNLRQRAKALISIAHPDHQADLEKAAFERFGQI